MISDCIDKLDELTKLLGDSDSQIMKEAEEYLNDEDLESFAIQLQNAKASLEDSCELLKKSPIKVSSKDLDSLASLAEMLDESGIEDLRKQAAVIDELFLTIAADPKAQSAFKKANDDEIERLRAKYSVTDVEKVAEKEDYKNEAIKAIDEKIKKYRPMEAALTTRYSPDMPGVSLMRIGDNIFQCPVTKKIYDYNSGFTTMKGNKVPGTSVENQTRLDYLTQGHSNFSSREDRLNQDK